MRNSDLSLREQLDYDPETGIMTWKIEKSGIVPGMPAGFKNKRGYVRVCFNGKQYRAHRLIWQYMTGELPTKQIDHINGIRDDNRWCNLREVNQYHNNLNVGKQRNNTSGHKGVSWDKNQKKWAVRCNVNKKQNFLGYFSDLTLAAQAYANFAKAHHGEYFRV